MVEQEIEKFLTEQRKSASGQRLEYLSREMKGERKLLQEVIYPVFGSFQGMHLEYELLTSSGTRIYVDVYHELLRFGFESEGFVPHAQNITRDRFSYEKSRVRTLGIYNIKYIPFSSDELNSRPELCRRSVYELIGRFGKVGDDGYYQLSVYEREVLRHGLLLHRPMHIKDVCYCLQCGPDKARKVLKILVEKELIIPLGGPSRYHSYILSDKAKDFIA